MWIHQFYQCKQVLWCISTADSIFKVIWYCFLDKYVWINLFNSMSLELNFTSSQPSFIKGVSHCLCLNSTPLKCMQWCDLLGYSHGNQTQRGFSSEGLERGDRGVFSAVGDGLSLCVCVCVFRLAVRSCSKSWYRPVGCFSKPLGINLPKDKKKKRVFVNDWNPCKRSHHVRTLNKHTFNQTTDTVRNNQHT